MWVVAPESMNHPLFDFFLLPSFADAGDGSGEVDPDDVDTWDVNRSNVERGVGGAEIGDPQPGRVGTVDVAAGEVETSQISSGNEPSGATKSD